MGYVYVYMHIIYIYIYIYIYIIQFHKITKLNNIYLFYLFFILQYTLLYDLFQINKQ